MTALDITRHFKAQGINKDAKYPAKVIDNNDPQQLGRVRARVDGIQEQIQDTDLPWAIPRFSHVDGAIGKKSGGGTNQHESGTFFVPKKGSFVTITFQDGDPYYPMWEGYCVDDTTKVKETLTNYPDRAVLKFANGSYIVVDTKTNEIFLNCPGDWHLSVLGDVNQVVCGDTQEVVSNNLGDLPAHFKTSTSLSEYKQTQNKKVPFQGLMAKGSGNKHLTIRGDYTMRINGNRKIVIDGNDTLTVGGNRNVTIRGNDKLTVGGSWTVTVASSGSVRCGGTFRVSASSIFLN